MFESSSRMPLLPMIVATACVASGIRPVGTSPGSSRIQSLPGVATRGCSRSFRTPPNIDRAFRSSPRRIQRNLFRKAVDVRKDDMLPQFTNPELWGNMQGGEESKNAGGGLFSDIEHHGWWDGGDMPERHRDEWLQNLRDRFEAADSDEDGELNMDELRSVLECTDQFCLARHWLPLEQVASVMRKYDKDASGTISFEEFVDMGDDHQLLMGVLDDYLTAFQVLDSDGNGRIERAEMRGLFETMVHRRVHDSEIELLFEKANLNGDGSTICFSEFLELIRSHTVDLQMVLDYMKLKPHENKPQPSSERSARQRSKRARSQPVEEVNDDKNVDKMPAIKPGEVAEVSSLKQLESVLETHSNVVLEVTYRYCRPCKMFARKYDAIAEQFPNIAFLKVVGDKNDNTRELIKQLQVRLSPTFIAYKNAERKQLVSGASDVKVRSMVMHALGAEGKPVR